MYYCLKEDYLLRGWEKLPTGIVRRMSGQIVFLDAGLYTKIKDMSWMLFQGSPFLTEKEKEALDELVKKGVMDLRETIRPLTEYQQYHFYPNRYLRAVHWAITGRCNCRCRHCYMSAPSGKTGEYSTEECMEIIGQMEKAGIQVVNLTGGEALVRKDFFRIAERLTQARDPDRDHYE